MTLAPISFASCSVATPTPDEAAVTSTVSPARNWPLTKSASWTTTKTIGTAAASSHDSRSGAGIASRTSISAYSANPPLHRPMTRSPGLKPVTPSPVSTTSPAASPPPGRSAGAGLPGSARRMRTARISARFNDEAWTRAKIWPGGTTGRCTSRMSHTPPSAPGIMIAACMLSPPAQRRLG